MAIIGSLFIFYEQYTKSSCVGYVYLSMTSILPTYSLMNSNVLSILSYAYVHFINLHRDYRIFSV